VSIAPNGCDLVAQSSGKNFPPDFQRENAICYGKSYQQITNRIIRAIETEGLLPWRKPWRAESPRNIRGNNYRGINRLVLSIQPYADPRWVTFKQVSELGGKVRRGEHGTPVLFWTEVEDEDAPENKKRLLARCYYVFNAEQTEGLQLAPLSGPTDESLCSTVEALASTMCPCVEVHRKGTAACYSPLEDVVVMPRAELFDSAEAFEQTLAHELIHATGHSTRLARKEVCDPIQFGSDPYAREELVAELGAAFLTADLGIHSDVEQSASYVAGWLKALKSDKSLVITAASCAQKAVDFILAPTMTANAA
jgi:antirestriction protein ArdC